MTNLEILENEIDEVIIKLFHGKTVTIEYVNGTKKDVTVRNFIKAVADCPQRSIVGIITDDGEEILISSHDIKSITII